MKRRVRCHVSGTVQGVGFRPFVYREAVRRGLAGFVQNTRRGVVVEVEGTEEAVAGLLESLKQNPPPHAEIWGLSCEPAPVQNEKLFRILTSACSGAVAVQSAPDTATCDDCLAELCDPADRRFGYPFINCTACGPRLTITRDVPYDRANTSMACFSLCDLCRQEYEDPADRRFHAEPNACPACGPSLRLLDHDGNEVLAPNPVRAVGDRLRSGAIVALKGLGGYHLCVDAGSDEAVLRLRTRKCREEKPLAIMVRDMSVAHSLAHVAPPEEELLRSPEHPIVLVGKRAGAGLAPSLAAGLPSLGLMLPYTPLQHLLFAQGLSALVMTSGNRTDEPICTGNREAVERLRGIADVFLTHNRDILVRCDDSIAMVSGQRPQVMRRARGHAPKPILLRQPQPDVLALGPHSKATICIVKGAQAFLSPHIGDLETPAARDFFHESIALMQKIAACRPGIVACDLHPGYYTTRAAAAMEGVRVMPVQHHHAHVVSCLADNGVAGPVIGVAMDGSGYGSDGHIWGAEFLLADEAAFARRGHLKEFFLPGGSQAIREPWRIAASLLRDAFGPAWQDEAAKLHLAREAPQYRAIDMMLAQHLNSPAASSLGRLFDGVAALLGICRAASFEGQAAMALEGAAGAGAHEVFPYAVEAADGQVLLDFLPTIREIIRQQQRGAARQALAACFHETVVHGIADVVERLRSDTQLNRVALSGGCFQNRRLLEGCLRQLRKRDFEVLCHRRVPPNDGGIALGQAVCAGAAGSSASNDLFLVQHGQDSNNSS